MLVVSKKSDPEHPIESPIPFHPCSNGEYMPGPAPRWAVKAEEIWKKIVEEKHKRVGLTRRQFAESASGVAAALFVINQIACGKDPEVAVNGGADGGMRRDASSMDASSVDASGADAGFYDIGQDAMDDPACAEELLYDPDGFVFDVQTHVANPPLSEWPEGTPAERVLDYIKEVFVQGGTTVAVISGVPNARNLGENNVIARTRLSEVLDELGGDRLRLHCNVDFNSNPSSEVDYMDRIHANYSIGGWKVYPYREQWLATQERGLMLADKARSLGVPIICAHRGIAGNGDYRHSGSPRDLVEAASQMPQVNYLCYHSGWEFGRSEDHPYDPNAAENQTFGMDRFIRAIQEFQIPRNTGNVYAELGSTWHNLRTQPAQATHAIGKLLLHLGEDRILFGTDSVFNGSPEGQIAAMRNFQIPAAMRQQFGYPEITDEIRRKILGLNAAPLYDVDPQLARCRFDGDDVDQLRMSWLDDRRSVPMPHPHRYRGPTTRREFFAFLKAEEKAHHT